jgi:hypothetical protein
MIDQIRFDLEDRPGAEFLIREVAIAETPNPAALGGPAVPVTTAPAASKP